MICRRIRRLPVVETPSWISQSLARLNEFCLTGASLGRRGSVQMVQFEDGSAKSQNTLTSYGEE